MQREIKFRGKWIDNNEYVYGSLVTKGDESFIVTKRGNVADFQYEVIPETVGQFIGLSDNNGKQIFEGDIVSYRPANDFYDEYEKVVGSALIVWGVCVFVDAKKEMQRQMKDGYKNDWHSIENATDMEVLGNVFENLELLSATQKAAA